MRSCLATLCGLFLSWCLFGCTTSPPDATKPSASSSGGTSPEPARTVARAGEDDNSAAELLKGRSVEAKAWLADPRKHLLWKASRERVVPLINEIYTAGAPAVHAAGISKVEDSADREMTSHFVIELPKDKAGRAKVIQVYNEFWRKALHDKEEFEETFAVADHGQNYLMLEFDN